MSMVNVVPELVATAAADVAGIGSSIEAARATAAVSIMELIPPAADSVSAQVAELFEQHAASYQTVSAKGGVFHDDFVCRLTASATSYTEAERASVATLGQGQGQGVRLLGARQHQPEAGLSRLWPPGMRDPRLIVPQRAALASRTSRLWLPSESRGLHLPSNAYPRGGLPPLSGTNAMQLLKRSSAGGFFPVVHQIIVNQISYLKLIATSLESFVKDELSAIIGLPAAFEHAVKDLLQGNIKGAMSDIEKGFLHFFINGMKWDGNVVHFGGDQYISWYEGEFTGALPDLWHLTRIPADEMQHLADLLKPLGFGYAGKLAQQLANPLNTLAYGWHVYCGNGSSNPRFKMDAPLAMLFDILGAPILSVEAFEDSIQATVDNLSSGHLLKAGIDLLTMPQSILHAFLFGQGDLHLPTFVSGRVPMGGAVHLGGLFAPLGYGEEFWSGMYDWAPVTNPSFGTLTGGLVPALVSMLPPKLQAPLFKIGWVLDSIIARLDGHSARP